MASRQGKRADQGRSRSKKVAVKKRAIKDLDAAGRDVKGGRESHPGGRACRAPAFC